MPQGNGAKAKQRRERQQAQATSSVPHSQLKSNQASQTILCKVCRQSFMSVSSKTLLEAHKESKHPKLDYSACFD